MTHAEDGVRLVTLSGYTSGLLGRLYGLCREMRGGRKVAIRMVDDKRRRIGMDVASGLDGLLR